MDRIAICCGTFGDRAWIEKAERALESARTQTIDPYQIIHVHEDTLQKARNIAVSKTDADWIVFVDADDELDRKYIEWMHDAIAKASRLAIKPTLFYPMVRKIDPTGEINDIVFNPTDLSQTNFMVIGTMFNRNNFIRVGGFWEEGVFEDWSLWLRMHRVCYAQWYASRSVYIQHYNPNGRNQNNPEAIRYWYNRIKNYNLK